MDESLAPPDDLTSSWFFTVASTEKYRNDHSQVQYLQSGDLGPHIYGRYCRHIFKHSDAQSEGPVPDLHQASFTVLEQCR
jgi:hypothetical protein